MRKLPLLVLLLACGCQKIGAEGADAEPEVVIYGVDEGAPRQPPEGCKKKGTIEVSAIETEELPEAKLRRAAADIGANGVHAIRKAGTEDTFVGEKRTYKAVAVRCPKKKLASSAAPAASPS